jgi:hypothetical protein
MDCKHEKREQTNEYRGAELFQATAYCPDCLNTWIYEQGSWNPIERHPDEVRLLQLQDILINSLTEN